MHAQLMSRQRRDTTTHPLGHTASRVAPSSMDGARRPACYGWRRILPDSPAASPRSERTIWAASYGWHRILPGSRPRRHHPGRSAPYGWRRILPDSPPASSRSARTAPMWHRPGSLAVGFSLTAAARLASRSGYGAVVRPAVFGLLRIKPTIS